MQGYTVVKKYSKAQQKHKPQQNFYNLVLSDNRFCFLLNRERCYNLSLVKYDNGQKHSYAPRAVMLEAILFIHMHPEQCLLEAIHLVHKHLE